MGRPKNYPKHAANEVPDIMGIKYESQIHLCEQLHHVILRIGRTDSMQVLIIKYLCPSV